MAMDLIHQVEQVKQKLEGALFNITVDVNQIYEELEQHRIREDRVDFVASLFLNRFGLNSSTDIAGTNALPAEVIVDGNSSEKQGECDVLSAGLRVDGTLLDNKGEQFGLQADVKVEMKPCNSKVDSSQVNNCKEIIFSIPCSSGISSAVNLPSSSNCLGTFSPARLDFDYDVNNNDPNNNTEYEMPHDTVSSSNNPFPKGSLHEQDDDVIDVEFSDQEHIREKLLSEATVIHTVVPQRTFGEIYSFLESNLDNENRLQVVMKYFLNQDFPCVEGTIDEEMNAKSNPEPHQGEQNDSVEKRKTVSCALQSETVKVNTTQETPTVVVEDTNSESGDSITLSDDETPDLPESECEILYQKENQREVIYVDCTNNNGKRQSLHDTEASPPKKSKTSCFKDVDNEKSVVLDLSLNCTVLPSGIHKHFSAVKEMFPNLEDRYLAKICSAYEETDDDLPRIVEELLQTVNNLENLCDPLLEPLPVFVPSAAREKEGVPNRDMPEFEAQHADTAEQERNCVAVFQQASSVLERLSCQEPLPSSSRSGPSLVDGIAQPISNIPDFVDGDSSSRSSSCAVLKTGPNKSIKHYVNGIQKLANHGEGAGNTDKAASSTNASSSVIATIAAASCAGVTAETLSDKVVNIGSKGKFADNSSRAITRTKRNCRNSIHVNSTRKLPSHVEGTSNIDKATSSRDSNCSEVTAVVASFTGTNSEALAGKNDLNIETEARCPTQGKRKLKKIVKEIQPKTSSTDHNETVLTQVTPSNVLDKTNHANTLQMPNNLLATSGEVVASTSKDGELSAAETDVQEQQKIDDRYECLLSIFPQADPTYLLDKSVEIGNDEEKLRHFIADALEKKNYPTYQEYQKRMEDEKQKKKVTTEFSVESFLEIFPNPMKYFLEQKKSVHVHSGLVFLKNRYPRTRYNDIITIFKKCKYNLTKTSQTLDRVKTVMKTKRPVTVCPNDTMDLQFLQEVAFIENRALIEEYMKKKKLEKKKAFEEAKARNELVECACCFNDEVLIDDIGTCNEGHLFCSDCIQRSAEVQVGDGKTTFPCLTTCESEFSLKTLQKFLKASLLSKVLQTRQLEEVKAASIEGIEFCPHCDFASILPEEDKVFHCLNPECMKETCRMCKEPNHVPKHCDEVEKSDEVKARTYIENRMSEALIRVCWKCKKPFIKEDGCNKMTCSCGAMMCYICRQKVTDYLHFNGQGGTEYHKCPLYSTNDELHVEVVKQEAMKAKEEVMQQNPNVQLKIDPTKVLPKPTFEPPFPGYYRRLLQQRVPIHPQELPLALPQVRILNVAELQEQEQAIQQALQVGHQRMANLMNRLHDLVRNT